MALRISDAPLAEALNDNILIPVGDSTIEEPISISVGQLKEYISAVCKALLITSDSYVTVSGVSTPSLSVDQVTQAYNAVVSGRGAIVIDKDETAHCYVNQADALNDDISINILYYNILTTYTVEGSSVTVTAKNLDA